MTVESFGGNRGNDTTFAKCRRSVKQRLAMPGRAATRRPLRLRNLQWLMIACGGFAIVSLVAFPQPLAAQTSPIATTKKSIPQDDTSKPLTGNELQEKLRDRVSATWSSAKFRPTLARLSSSQRVAIFVDRRVDPGLTVNFSAERIALGELIYQFAETANCGVCWLGDVAYVGPESEVARLVFLRQNLLSRIDEKSQATRRRWLTKGKFECQRLQQPQGLWNALVSELGMETEDQLPHDLMPAYSFPSVYAVDRLILICFGFDRWPIWIDNQLRLIEVPEAGPTRCYVIIESSIRQSVIDTLAQRFPETEVKLSRDKLSWTVEPLTSYRIRRTAMGLKFSDGEIVGGEANNGTSVYSFSSTVSIEQVLRTAASKMQVELEYDASLREQMIRRIELNVTRVTLDELIVAALEGTGFVHELSDGKLIVRQK